MLSITIERAKGSPIKFNWRATAEEAERLWNEMEKMAETKGHDPGDLANQVIYITATKGVAKDKVQQRGQMNWIVYAVLRHASERIDMSKMIDQAGVIKGTPTVFDLAEHQHIKAAMRLDDKGIVMSITGASLLDS